MITMLCKDRVNARVSYASSQRLELSCTQKPSKAAELTVLEGCQAGFFACTGRNWMTFASGRVGALFTFALGLKRSGM